jgi:hypothetical protein
MIGDGVGEAALAVVRIRLVALKRGGPWPTAPSYEASVDSGRSGIPVLLK